MKRTLSLALLAALLGSVAAAQGDPNTLVDGTLGDWGTGFDPVYCYDTACGNVADNTLESLFGFDNEDPTDVKARIAAEIPSVENGGISQDGKTYTIKLRSGVTFRDGTPVTAEDVEYSLERMMVYSTDVGPAGLLLEPFTGTAELLRPDMDTTYADIDKAIETEGEDTVILTLAKPFAPLISTLAGYYGSVYSKADAIAQGDWDGTEATWQDFNNTPEGTTSYSTTGPLGTGPFYIERYDVGKTVILKRNDNYWREPAALERVIIQSVPDDNTRLEMFRTGDLDLISRDALPQALVPMAREVPGAVVNQGPGLSLYGFFMTEDIDGSATNYLGSGKLDGKGIPANFFNDVNVRKAFAYAFDYNAFIKDVMLDAAKQQNTTAIEGLIGYDPNGPKFTTDPAQATEYFKKAHDGQVWENGFTLPVFWNSGNTTRQQGLQIMKRNIEALNPKFHIDVRELQFSQILTQASAHQLTMWMGGWGADFADPHSFAQPFLHTNGNYPQNMNFSDDELDMLIDLAVLETDPEKRTRMYKDIAETGFEKLPELPAYQPLQTFISHDWVQGRIHNPIWSSDYYYLISKAQ